MMQNHNMLLACGFTCRTLGHITYYARGLPAAPTASNHQHGATWNAATGRTTAPAYRQQATKPPVSSPGARAAEAAEAGQGPTGAASQRTPGNSGSGAGTEAGPAPFVVLHGVGMGLLPYVMLLVGLAATGECGWW